MEKGQSGHRVLIDFFSYPFTIKKELSLHVPKMLMVFIIFSEHKLNGMFYHIFSERKKTMVVLSENDFLRIVGGWIEKNEQKIRNMWPQKGGWEEWAKTDIYDDIVQLDSSYDILREQPIFTGGRDADFLLNHSSGTSQQVGIEMKCQSFENYKKFTDGLLKDVEKFKYLKPDKQGIVQLVIGLYFTEHGKDIPGYFSKKIVGSGEVGMCWAINYGS